MSGYERVKNSKFFAKGDILVYLLIVALLIFFFIAFSVESKPSLSAISATVATDNGEVEILLYDFDTGKVSVHREWEERITVEKDSGKVIISITFDDGLSVLTLDTEKRSAVMSYADCSYHHDCTSFLPIQKGEQVIICIPRGLIIKGIGDESDIMPEVG